MSQLHIVIYGKPNCFPCSMSKKYLVENDIPHTDCYYGNPEETNMVDVSSTNQKKREWSEQKIEKLKATYGAKAMPVVKVVDGTNNVIDYWTGYQPNKIQQYFPRTR